MLTTVQKTNTKPVGGERVLASPIPGHWRPSPPRSQTHQAPPLVPQPHGRGEGLHEQERPSLAVSGTEEKLRKDGSLTGRAGAKIRKLHLSGLSLTFRTVTLNAKKCLKSHKRDSY